MGEELPFQILYSESATLFGRIVCVYGQEILTGICASGGSRTEVAEAIRKKVDAYLSEHPRKSEQEI